MDISSLRERPSKSALTVSELNNYVKSIIDSDRVLSAVSVTGEISNLTVHRSGHVYFTLKDSDAQIRAVMFRYAHSRLKFTLEEGMKVSAHGSVSVYPQTGSVQLYVNSMTPDGIGAHYKAYEQLKSKLDSEGLFADEHKKPIPRFPRRIGVITSPTGAAVRDIINVTSRRYPLADIYLYPSLVQGDGAEQNLIKALDYLDASALVDVIIIGRGGGSIEDLWAFNSEPLARRIFSAQTPIISAVGHETDFTICDFVSDLRAPTPSAAAELAVPDFRDVAIALDNTASRISSSLTRVAQRKRERLQCIADKPVFKDSRAMISDRSLALVGAMSTAEAAIKRRLADLSSALKIESGKANAMSPLSVLARGYSITEHGGNVIYSVKDIAEGDPIVIRIADGVLDAEVKAVTKQNKRKTK
ncbi:MAG: exodeoxyribonuclease VII large subunit [Clostridia bacterium]|nr:exodeoxyribonuclease VII large subunit [Clostridia bacterium]